MQRTVAYEVHCQRNGCLLKSHPERFEVPQVNIFGLFTISIPFMDGIHHRAAILFRDRHAAETTIETPAVVANHSCFVVPIRGN